MGFPPTPSPSRQRLYTSLGLYARVAFDLATGGLQRGEDAVQRLEAEVRRITGSPFALAVNQARIGIYLALKAAVRPGKTEVILSPFTIFDVVNMVLCAGATPVFADVLPEACTLDPAQVEAKIGPRTAAVLVTHTHVVCREIDGLRALCRTHGALLVEDGAIAWGTRFQGHAVGTLGDVGVFSFGLFKNVNAIYGGAVVTADPELHAKMKAEHDTFGAAEWSGLVKRVLYGLAIDGITNPVSFRLLTFWVFRYGLLNDVEFINRRSKNDPDPFRRTALPDSMKIKMSPAQARWALYGLPQVERDFAARLALAREYHRGLADLAEIRVVPVGDDQADGFVAYPMRVTDRAAMLKHLARHGRDCPYYYYRNCSKLACFAEFAADCPNAEAAANFTVLLPTYTSYGIDEARENVRVIRSYFGRPA